MLQEAADGARDTAGDVKRIRRRLEGLLGIPATEGNRLTVLRNGDEIFPAMLDAIAAAERTVDLLTFVYWRGDIAREFAHALGGKAREGLRVRVLLDAFGGRLIDKALIAHMESRGVQVEWFRKLFVTALARGNHRTHRKVLVCDGRVAFTGGVGIAEEWCGDARNPGEWRDTHVRVEGPAVDGVAAAFAQNWAESGRPLVEDGWDELPDHPHAGDAVVQVVRGSATVGWGDMSTVFRIMIESARERLRITTAYFVPDPAFLRLLCESAGRGVEVDVLLPGPYADKRVVQLASEATYDVLVDCGVRVWNYRPTMLHAKVTTVDGIASVVGSSNFNRRSMALDEEVVLCVLDPESTAVLDRHFEEDLSHSERIERRRWGRRPARQRAAEAATAVARRWF